MRGCEAVLRHSYEIKCQYDKIPAIMMLRCCYFTRLMFTMFNIVVLHVSMLIFAN